MWTREVLKSRAKAVLKTNYWKAFLISLVVVISGGSGGSGSNSAGGSSNNDSIRSAINNVSNNTLDNKTIFIIVMGAIVLAIAFRILLGYSLEVGGRKYFVQSAQYKDNKGCISFAFDGKNYSDLILTMLLLK